MFKQGSITLVQDFQNYICTTSFANKGTHLRQLHLHVGKNMQESHHSIPQPAVSETLLVPNARALKVTTQTASKPIRIAQECIACRCYVTWLPVCTLLKS